jgi:hypothetical protein
LALIFLFRLYGLWGLLPKNHLEALYMVNETSIKIEDKEKRVYDRVYFSAEDRIVGTFVFPGNKKKLEAHIMNISAGGLHFTMNRKEMISLKIGDRLILTKMIGSPSLQIVSDIELEIKWKLDYRLMKHVGFGCEFRIIPELVRFQLSKFFESGTGCSSLPEQ